MQWLSFGNVGLADIDCPVLFSLLGALTECTNPVEYRGARWFEGAQTKQ